MLSTHRTVLKLISGRAARPRLVLDRRSGAAHEARTRGSAESLVRGTADSGSAGQPDLEHLCTVGRFDSEQDAFAVANPSAFRF